MFAGVMKIKASIYVCVYIGMYAFKRMQQKKVIACFIKFNMQIMKLNLKTSQ